MVNDSADDTFSARSFQVCGPATGKLLPNTTKRFLIYDFLVPIRIGLDATL